MAFSQTSLAQSEIVQAASLEQAVEQLSSKNFALILLDLNLSDTNNFDGLIRLKNHENTAPVIIVSATENRAAYQKASELGAQGYIPKSLSLDAIAAAIDAVLGGQNSFPEGWQQTGASDMTGRINSLTPAQRKVMNGLSGGLLNKQIAYEMGISEATVKAHMTSIFRKLGANNRTQALLLYREAISLPEA